MLNILEYICCLYIDRFIDTTFVTWSILGQDFFPSCRLSIHSSSLCFMGASWFHVNPQVYFLCYLSPVQKISQARRLWSSFVALYWVSTISQPNSPACLGKKSGPALGTDLTRTRGGTFWKQDHIEHRLSFLLEPHTSSLSFKDSKGRDYLWSYCAFRGAQTPNLSLKCLVYDEHTKQRMQCWLVLCQPDTR